MDSSDGMVAIVRGLRDSGLTVTLLDGTREYTLMPNAVGRKPPPRHQSTQHHAEARTDYSIQDVGAQIADGRYTSTYRTAHCNVKPTSPPIELTEFPPQRAELYHGQDNFEVGGGGSRETHSPIRASARYRGAMVWPDRGSVCTPRPSPPTDPFANSLRKYPCMSPERSSEIVERLINYTQSKNSSKTHTIRNQTSPQRLSDLSCSCDYAKTTKMSATKTPPCWEALDVVDRGRLDESPTREGRSKKAEGDGPDTANLYNRNYDVKCLRDIAKRVKQNVRLSAHPYTQPVCPHIRDNCNNLPPATRRLPQQNSTKTNTEIQAVVKMVSKEVATVPRPEPVKRTIAIPLTPTSSVTDRKEDESQSENKANQTYFAPKLTFKRKSMQTLSFTDLTRKDVSTIYDTRKIRSQEQINYNNQDVFKRCVFEWFQNANFNAIIKKNIIDDLSKNSLGNPPHKSFETKLNTCVNTVPSFLTLKYHDFEREIVDSNMCYDDFNSVFRAEMSSLNKHERRQINFVIKSWVESLPIKYKSVDKNEIYKNVDRKKVYYTVSEILNEYIRNRYEIDIKNVKSEIVEHIKDLPVELGNSSEAKYFNAIVDSLLKRIRNIFIYQSDESNRINIFHNVSQSTQSNKHMTEENLEQLIRKQLQEYLEKYDLKMSKLLMQDVENELTDILVNSTDWFSLECEGDLKFQMKYILRDVANWSEVQADNFINDVFRNLLGGGNICTYNQMYTVLPTMLQNTNVHSKSHAESSDFSIGGITQGDLNNNLDFYVNQLCEAIEGWLSTLNINQINDKGFRQVVVHDLAGDIVDRHKYLEMNPTSRGSEQDELENLKYQIFKWVNKLVGENNTETIQHAEELMERIRNIPVPMLKMPGNENMASHYPEEYSQKSSTIPRNKMITTGIPMSSRRRMSSPNTLASHLPDINQSKQQYRKMSSPAAFSTDPTLQQKVLRQEPTGMSGQATAYESMVGNYGSKLSSSRRLESSPGSSAGLKNNYCNPNHHQEMQDLQSNKVESPQWVEKKEFKSGQARRMSSPGGILSAPMTHNADIDRNTIRSVSKERRKSSPGSMFPTTEIINGISVNGPTASTATQSNEKKCSPEVQPNSCCLPKDTSYQMSPSIKKLNEEYDNYLKQWVQEIPIVATTPEEEKLVDKFRLGIFNGIWKALTKLKFEPEIFNNRFYYQDVLDDEIEELLNLLPQTPELQAKKHMMKAKLIEKTSDTNDLIRSSAASSSYKQQLVDNVEQNLPKKSVKNKKVCNQDPMKMPEELQKLKLVEDFILYTRFKDDNMVKANVYKNKLLKNVEELVRNIQQQYGKELIDIDPELYINEIVTALNKVPIPSENTVREEADEILLLTEIEQWFSDLPLVESGNDTEELLRRRLRESLAKKIHDIRKERNLSSCAGVKEVKFEVSKFLEKLPLKEGTDKLFVMGELVNRLKNRPKETIRRKSVAFQDPESLVKQNNSNGTTPFVDPPGYQDFSKNMPFCSSFIEKPGVRIDQQNDSYSQPSDEQWFSLTETKMPLEMLNAIRTQDNSILSQIPQQICGQPGCSQTPVQNPPNELTYPNTVEGSRHTQNIQPTVPQNWTNYQSQPSTEQWVSLQEIPPELAKQIRANQTSHIYSSPPVSSHSAMKVQSGTPSGSKAFDQNRVSPNEPHDTQPYTNAVNRSRTCCNQPNCQNSINRTADNSFSPINQNPNIIQMAGGGMGILGTSQVAGPSGIRHYGSKTTQPCCDQSTGMNATFRRSTDRNGIQEIIANQNSIREPSRQSTPESVAMTHPVGFSTPQQNFQGELPLRPTKKTRQITRPLDTVKRRLDMDDSDVEESGRETNERCRCMDRLRRSRRQKPCMCPLNGYGIQCPHLIPIRYPYAYFF